MEIQFTKYQGTGNDFILLDNSKQEYDTLQIGQIQRLCNRKFGVGADGLIKINQINGFDFEADYYNSDGTKSFCGNGARCAVMFAKSRNLFEGTDTQFLAIDGEHSAEIQGNEVSLLMKEVRQTITHDPSTFEINTGSPHFIRYVDNLSNEDIVSFGRSIRYNPTYEQNGINVNLVEIIGENEVKVQTYERGVEDETLSCGTGVTAVALSLSIRNKKTGSRQIKIHTKGGELSVSFFFDGTIFTDIHLIGPAAEVFQGNIVVE